ncbi:unnamed protein product [Parnassius apollo]|uniref:(apollo) hypothetical protein n=1 Tax=Parnassius apollo TaxID=110799 RepID=A0A8S3XYL7_PARAO|nr:unnamed protein product [Parnassius apollo]
MLNQKDLEITALRFRVMDDQATAIFDTKIDDLRKYFEELLSRIKRSFVRLPQNNEMEIQGNTVGEV